MSESNDEKQPFTDEAPPKFPAPSKDQIMGDFKEIVKTLDEDEVQPDGSSAD